MKPRGWHRVTVEWSDGTYVVSAASEFIESDMDTDIDHLLAGTIGDVVRHVGRSDFLVAAQMLADTSKRSDPCEETLAEASARFIRRRRGDWDK